MLSCLKCVHRCEQESVNVWYKNTLWVNSFCFYVQLVVYTHIFAYLPCKERRQHYPDVVLLFESFTQTWKVKVSYVLSANTSLTPLHCCPATRTTVSTLTGCKRRWRRNVGYSVLWRSRGSPARVKHYRITSYVLWETIMGQMWYRQYIL